MILLFGPAHSRALDRLEGAARDMQLPLLRIAPRQLVRMEITAHTHTPAGVTMQFRFDDTAFASHEVSGVLNAIDELALAEFAHVAADDRLFVWRELQACFEFILRCLPNSMAAPPQRSLCFQWRRAAECSGLPVPLSWLGAPAQAPAALLGAGALVISPGAFLPEHWRAAPLPGPRGPYLFIRRPRGALLRVVVLDGESWIDAAALPADSERRLRQAAAILAAAFSLRWAELVFFYEAESHTLSFGSIHPFSASTDIGMALARATLRRLAPYGDRQAAQAPRRVAPRQRPLLDRPLIARAQRRPVGPIRLQDGAAPLPRPHGILIVADAGDPTVAHFRQYAALRGVPVVLWPAAALAGLNSHCLSAAALAAVTGIWLRPCATQDQHHWQLLAWLEDMLAFVEAPVVGRIAHASSNGVKPLHTCRIAAHATRLVRAIPSYLQSACAAGAVERVVKAASGEKVEVRRLRDMPCADGIYPAPVHLQDVVEGANIRVQVCGSRLQALRIHSPRLDYRFDPAFGVSEVALPPEVGRWCVAAARREGAVLAGIDLLQADGSDFYYCLEINPHPGYQVFDQRLLAGGGVPEISAWLLDYLAARHSGKEAA